jgi:hypothetical protein
MYEATDYVKDDVWALSQLGNVINSYVDREVNKATAIDNSTGYGLDDNGRMYALGQPAYASAPVPAQQPVNSMLLLLVLAAVVIAVNK